MLDLTGFLGEVEEKSQKKRVAAPSNLQEESTSMLPGTDEEITWEVPSAIDYVLQGRTMGDSASVRALTDRGRKESGLSLPVEAGTRVSFRHNVGSVFMYRDVPAPGVEGTVILVRTRTGDKTASEMGVHVKWDDGVYRIIEPEYLKEAKPSNRRAAKVRKAFEGFGNSSLMAQFMRSRQSSSDLIHKATHDLWSFSEDGEGNFVIERLYDEDGNPIKE